MSYSKPIYIDDYTYQLEDEKIAKYPLQLRDQSKLLIYNDGAIQQDIFNHIDQHLPNHSSLFYNNTRVIPARIIFRKPSGTYIEVFCLNPYNPSDYQTAFLQKDLCTWECLVGNLKKWKKGKLLLTITIQKREVILEAEIKGKNENNLLISFSWNGGYNFADILNYVGKIPIPPYLNRDTEIIDNERYQTVYSKFEGSVAAPTAGLHFTDDILNKLKENDVIRQEITLHVGAGTFQPVKKENIFEHEMHQEFFTVDSNIVRFLADSDRPCIATGTTTLRTLESLYWLAVKSIVSKKLVHVLEQWDYDNLPTSVTSKEAFTELANLLDKESCKEFSANTKIMIVPGYNFKVVNGLITNFHQPKSSLLLLIAAFVGTRWREIYDYALKNQFRFLSYGDSSLLWR